MTDNRRRLKVMSRNWTDLALIVSRSGYDATICDRHYGATEPLTADTCQCQPPGPALAGECWKCGRAPVTESPLTRSEKP